MLLFRNSRKVHPILSSLTSTHPSTVEGCVDVDRNLVSSLFLEFLNSFVNGKLVKTSRTLFRSSSVKKVLWLQNAIKPQQRKAQAPTTIW